MDRSQANAYVAELGQTLGIDDLELNDEEMCMLTLGDDELIVSLGLDATGGMRVMICLDDVVPMGSQLAELLTENFIDASSGGGTFALLPETGALVLHRRCHAQDLQAGGLAEVLAGMASVARHWREQLLAEAASSEPSEPHSFLGERA